MEREEETRYNYFDPRLSILRAELAALPPDPRKGKCHGCGCPVRDGYERCGKPECSPFYGRD